jgi:hypothetical protein
MDLIDNNKSVASLVRTHWQLITVLIFIMYCLP